MMLFSLCFFFFFLNTLRGCSFASIGHLIGKTCFLDSFFFRSFTTVSHLISERDFVFCHPDLII